MILNFTLAAGQTPRVYLYDEDFAVVGSSGGYLATNKTLNSVASRHYTVDVGAIPVGNYLVHTTTPVASGYVAITDATGPFNVMVDQGGLNTQQSADTVLTTPTGESQAAFSKMGATSTISADEISRHRTWYGSVEGYELKNIVTVPTFSTPLTFSIEFDDESLNPGTVIQSPGTVTVTKDSDGTVIATSSLALRKDQKALNFKISAISDIGNYTVRASVVTTDSETINKKGKLLAEN